MTWFKLFGLLILLEIVCVKPGLIRNQHPLDAVSITSGAYHSCVLLEPTKALKCFGDNFSGQLGLGLDPGTRDSPTSNQVIGNEPDQLGNNLAFVKLSARVHSIIQVDAGGYHTCALLDIDGTGRVKCWGSNNRIWRQLGLGNSAPTRIGRHINDMGDSLDFVNLGHTARVVQISAGYAHTCILFDDSNVKCWGWNNYGQLGSGDRQNIGDPSSSNPIDFGLGNMPLQVSAGKTHTCATLNTGSVLCWGSNDCGQVSFDHAGLHLLPVAAPLDGSRATHVSAGGSHTCVLVDNGKLKCWGDNMYGQLGCDHNHSMHEAGVDTWISFPQQEIVKQVVTGEYHTCAISSGGQVYCWGRNDEGQLGTGDTVSRNRPTLVMIDATVTQISVGVKHTCALLQGKSVKCWGGNRNGQLATGYHEGSLSPALVEAIDFGTQVSSN
mmetsp:Transcript_33720/g.41489  ORF Transcript_33720/g.41489 Transcript_33720/m.41489 type:complete len:438 (+) Transcript_33720:160-1473(+)